MPKKFNTLVNNNAFLSYIKIHSHKEHTIGFFVETNTTWNKSRQSNVDRSRRRDQSTIASRNQGQRWITDRETTHSHTSFWLLQQRIGTGSGPNRITKFAYKIRTSRIKPTMLKTSFVKLQKKMSTILNSFRIDWIAWHKTIQWER